jgi:hypothetical protein
MLRLFNQRQIRAACVLVRHVIKSALRRRSMIKTRHVFAHLIVLLQRRRSHMNGANCCEAPSRVAHEILVRNHFRRLEAQEIEHMLPPSVQLRLT